MAQRYPMLIFIRLIEEPNLESHPTAPNFEGYVEFTQTPGRI
jgi:hypothetical protein